MRSSYSILRIDYIPLSAAGGVRRAVGGYLRYIQFRDQQREGERTSGVDAFVRYVAHRDRSARGGGIFVATGDATSADRRRLIDFIARSTAGLSPRWFERADGKLEDRQRAAYQVMISPDDAHGLDLRRIARVAMQQLESDAGPDGIGPWFAAEHRNTSHRHVQLVLPARREVSPGVFKTLVINRSRLQRMKEAMWIEIARQRGHALEQVLPERARQARSSRTVVAPLPHANHLTWRRIRDHQLRAGTPGVRRLRWRVQRPSRGHVAHEALLRLRGAAVRYRLQMERELERQSVAREAWER